ncbi:MAG: hypothetical protein IPJ19_10750 [Planctomycetes bacterium]|nr:hypothetical protein [Planctomycetota bacterium]
MVALAHGGGLEVEVLVLHDGSRFAFLAAAATASTAAPAAAAVSIGFGDCGLGRNLIFLEQGRGQLCEIVLLAGDRLDEHRSRSRSRDRCASAALRARRRLGAGAFAASSTAGTAAAALLASALAPGFLERRAFEIGVGARFVVGRQGQRALVLVLARNEIDSDLARERGARAPPGLRRSRVFRSAGSRGFVVRSFRSASGAAAATAAATATASGFSGAIAGVRALGFIERALDFRGLEGFVGLVRGLARRSGFPVEIGGGSFGRLAGTAAPATAPAARAATTTARFSARVLAGSGFRLRTHGRGRVGVLAARQVRIFASTARRTRVRRIASWLPADLGGQRTVTIGEG